MPLNADQIIDRKRLKQQISSWRSLALLLVFGAAAFVSWSHFSADAPQVMVGRDYIARVEIKDIITDDPKRDAMLEEIAENPHVKAVLVTLDTPGGTTVGGEELYLQLRNIAKTKPVVALMRTLCASAGYMSALGADRIYARESTLTGSIGVLMESVEVSELAKKIGVSPITITSGEFKDVPSMFRPITPREKQAVADVVNDAYAFFRGLVAKHRKLSEAELGEVANGRIFTGRQALQYRLIDALGGQTEAITWLETEKKLAKDLPVRDIKPEPEYENFLEKLQQMAGFEIFSRAFVPLDGLVAIWHPAVK